MNEVECSNGGLMPIYWIAGWINEFQQLTECLQSFDSIQLMKPKFKSAINPRVMKLNAIP